MEVNPTHSVVDLAGNSMVDVTVIDGLQSTYYYDVNPPDVTLSTSLSSPTDASTIPIEIDFDETVTHFNVSDIQLSGTATSIAGFGGSEAAYWANVVLSGEGPYSISIPASRANDFAGNANNASNVLSGVRDLTAPVINVPTQIFQATDPGKDTAIVTFPLNAEDAVDGPVATTVTTSPTTGLNSGDVFPLGTTTVTVFAEDAAGNSDTKQFTVIVGDAELPTFSSTQGNININIPFDESSAIVTYPTPTATDNVGSPTITRTSGLASGSAFPVGTTTITHRAEDIAGNFADQSFDVVVTHIPPGSLEVRVNSVDDGNVALSSSAPAFNQTINVSGGSGSTGQMQVRSGSYSVAYALPAGFILTSSSCDNTDGQVLPSLNKIEVDLVSAQNIVCTLDMYNAAGETSTQVQNFIDGRARQIISNQPRQNRRLGRIQGNAAQPGGFNLFGFQAPNAGHMPVAVNVASDAIELNYPTAQTGQQRQDWDAWAEATFSRFETDIDAGNFATLHMGYDYLLSPTSIIGIGASIDYTHANLTGSTGYTNGFGFMVGPYYTGEISENLYLDITAKIGRSFNHISTAGTAEDQFGATRGLLNASLFGEVELDQLTVRPDVGLNYFYERTDAFVNNLGLTIAEQETRLGDLTFGTTFAWSQPLENGWHLTPYVALNGIWTFDSATANGANTIGEQLRAKTEFGLTLNGNANQSFDLSIAYDGIGDPNYQALSAKFGLSAGF
ncbi:HYR domain-containing protein [Maritalea sp. S77]|uniref:HYR domain-containing protein n=1 Tax=Maritalea sp. S77 TaxID=3415125 RepID=UPI003C7AB34B